VNGLSPRAIILVDRIHSLICLVLCRNELSLYANITRIAWKYGDAQVVGTVSDRQQKDLRPFSFDPAATSSFEIANRLWEVIA
jgi:hypothetical protein